MKRKLIAVFSLILGALIGATAFVCVVIPNNLMGGGMGGLALLINHLTGWPITILLAAFFVPIAIWAFFKYGIKQIISALFSFVLFSVFMGVLPLFMPVLKTDAILAALVAGLLFGVGAGLVLRLGLANGPESLIGMALKQKFNLPIGTYFTLFNTAVLAASLIYSDITLALYSAISIFITGKITNFIILGFGRYFEMNIITSQYLDLTEFIHKSVGRGVTYIQCLGTYELKKQMMVKTLVKSDELIKIKNHLKTLDPDCFIYINESAEVIGKGFGEQVRK